MAEYVGSPEVTEGIWITGEKGDILRTVDMKKFGEPIKRIYLIPSEKTMYKHNIEEDKLDYTIDPHGVYVLEIPSEYYQILSDNPEDPRVLIWCDFLGRPKEDTIVGNLKAQLVRKDRIIASQQIEIAKLDKLVKTKLQKLSAMESFASKRD